MNPLFDLSGRTALVTGAGSGLGRQFASTLATANAQVVLCGRRREKLEETAALFGDSVPAPLIAPVDVTDNASVGEAFALAESTFGGVDILVNNAGVARVDSLLDGDESAFDLTLDTNVKAVWLVSREFARRISKRDQGGVIINIASILATGTSGGLGAYMAAKSGVVQLTRAMALEWSELGIRANAIAPGYFPSEMTGDYLNTPEGQAVMAHVPLRRHGELAELAGPLLLLASDASSYMNGSVVTVDGGHLCQPL